MRKLRITIENKSYEVTVEDLTEEQPYKAAAASLPAGPTVPAEMPQPTRAAAPAAPSEAGAIISPMAGAIKAVKVTVGDKVTQGQSLVILEAMKMENQITAPLEGTVTSVNVKEGDSVRESQVLLVLG